MVHLVQASLRARGKWSRTFRWYRQGHPCNNNLKIMVHRWSIESSNYLKSWSKPRTQLQTLLALIYSPNCRENEKAHFRGGDPIHHSKAEDLFSRPLAVILLLCKAWMKPNMDGLSRLGTHDSLDQWKVKEEVCMFHNRWHRMINELIKTKAARNRQDNSRKRGTSSHVWNRQPKRRQFKQLVTICNHL